MLKTMLRTDTAVSHEVLEISRENQLLNFMLQIASQ